MIKKYNICGRTYTVENIDIFLPDSEDDGRPAATTEKKEMEDEACEGKCFGTLQKIVIADSVRVEVNGAVRKRKIHPERKKSTICHEVIHSWLEENGYFELNLNETFVQTMGNSLYEFLKTAEFTEE
jgi:hypothetical protein